MRPFKSLTRTRWKTMTAQAKCQLIARRRGIAPGPPAGSLGRSEVRTNDASRSTLLGKKKLRDIYHQVKSSPAWFDEFETFCRGACAKRLRISLGA